MRGGGIGADSLTLFFVLLFSCTALILGLLCSRTVVLVQEKQTKICYLEFFSDVDNKILIM